MEVLYKSILEELKHPIYNNNKDVVLLTLYINDIINENKDTPEDIFNDFHEIKNLIGNFDIKYPWGININADIIIEKKLNQLYNLFI